MSSTSNVVVAWAIAHGMNFVFNYKDYALRNTIPLGMVRQTLYIGLTHYPELIHKIYILDAPFLFRAVWAFIQPFLDASTKSKIQFVTGDKAKREHLLPVFDTACGLHVASRGTGGQSTPVGGSQSVHGRNAL
jgi:hypothetical protein